MLPDHACLRCGHECCKIGDGNASQPKRAAACSTPSSKPEKRALGHMDNYLTELHSKARKMPQTPSIKRLKVN